MSPIAHFLASWTLADAARLGARDRGLVTWCGILPDLDGLGVAVDLGNRLLGRPESWYYGLYHHSFLHGLATALLLPAILCIFATERLRVFILGFVAIHLHLLGDLVGSRGPGPDDIWPVPYLAPFFDLATVQWQGQWPLNAWPNVALTIAFLAYVFMRAARAGYSPLEMFSARADAGFVGTIRNRWQAIRRSASSRGA
ncbi:MAG TPA: metal-dependent hydrolase [Candidatus Methylomirabilis sp.]|nr:metal-dependent hydrolase [Candidatus Methylomirabilis sp.]